MSSLESAASAGNWIGTPISSLVQVAVLADAVLVLVLVLAVAVLTLEFVVVRGTEVLLTALGVQMTTPPNLGSPLKNGLTPRAAFGMRFRIQMRFHLRTGHSGTGPESQAHFRPGPDLAAYSERVNPSAGQRLWHLPQDQAERKGLWLVRLSVLEAM